MKDAAKCLRRLEIGSVAPAIGRFATFANTFARPTTLKRILALQAVARLNFVNPLWFWFHCWFSHNHTVAYGKLYVNLLARLITLFLRIPITRNRLTQPARFPKLINIKQLFIAVTLSLSLNSMPAVGADLSKGLAAAKIGDYKTAVKEWLPLAREGDASAQFNIGQLYRLGRGVTKDYAKASQWYEKAAEQWHTAARHNLAVLYEKGLGVPVDYAKAIEWYTRAANQDYGFAQFNLAVIYSLGQGTKRDLVKAHIWYDIAAHRHVDGAAENRDAVAKHLTEEQLREARQEAREWIDWRKKE
jgi:hypothetical protein